MSKKELLNVKIKNGTFYISSKEDKGEGWTKQEFPNPQKKKETLVRYHKTLSIEGRLNHLAMGDDKFQGKVLNLIVGGESESYSLSVPIMDTEGSINTTNQYFNSLVGALENIKKGDQVTMFVNSKNYDKNDHLYRNIVTLDSDGKLIKSNFSFSDVPRWESNETTDDFGETVTQWDASSANKFYIDKFKKVVQAFKSKTETETPKEKTVESPKTEAKVETKPVETKVPDNLPF